MMSTKAKRKPSAVAHRRVFALLLIGLMMLPLPFSILFAELEHRESILLPIAGVGYLAALLISMMWMPYTIYHVERYRLRWWGWLLVFASMVSHVLNIIMLIGNLAGADNSGVQLGTLF